MQSVQTKTTSIKKNLPFSRSREWRISFHWQVGKQQRLQYKPLIFFSLYSSIHCDHYSGTPMKVIKLCATLHDICERQRSVQSFDRSSVHHVATKSQSRARARTTMQQQQHKNIRKKNSKFLREKQHEKKRHNYNNIKRRIPQPHATH